jgi:hypothetical protein
MIEDREHFLEVPRARRGRIRTPIDAGLGPSRATTVLPGPPLHGVWLLRPERVGAAVRPDDLPDVPRRENADFSSLRPAVPT